MPPRPLPANLAHAQYRNSLLLIDDETGEVVQVLKEGIKDSEFLKKDIHDDTQAKKDDTLEATPVEIMMIPPNPFDRPSVPDPILPEKQAHLPETPLNEQVDHIAERLIPTYDLYDELPTPADNGTGKSGSTIKKAVEAGRDLHPTESEVSIEYRQDIIRRGELEKALDIVDERLLEGDVEALGEPSNGEGKFSAVKSAFHHKSPQEQVGRRASSQGSVPKDSALINPDPFAPEINPVQSRHGTVASLLPSDSISQFRTPDNFPYQDPHSREPSDLLSTPSKLFNPYSVPNSVVLQAPPDIEAPLLPEKDKKALIPVHEAVAVPDEEVEQERKPIVDRNKHIAAHMEPFDVDALRGPTSPPLLPSKDDPTTTTKIEIQTQSKQQSTTVEEPILKILPAPPTSSQVEDPREVEEGKIKILPAPSSPHPREETTTSTIQGTWRTAPIGLEPTPLSEPSEDDAVLLQAPLSPSRGNSLPRNRVASSQHPLSIPKTPPVPYGSPARSYIQGGVLLDFLANGDVVAKPIDEAQADSGDWKGAKVVEFGKWAASGVKNGVYGVFAGVFSGVGGAASWLGSWIWAGVEEGVKKEEGRKQKRSFVEQEVSRLNKRVSVVYFDGRGMGRRVFVPGEWSDRGML